jgi:hypothetical protein|tara:strand:- start:145 stop:462 length:318 start_codon:yes stop_codon:yes gene_type:complete
MNYFKILGYLRFLDINLYTHVSQILNPKYSLWSEGMMKSDSIRKKKQRYLFILPIIFTLLMAGGAYLGIQLSKMWGVSDPITWPIIFTTLGFVISIVISISISKI